MTVSERVRILREAKGWSLAELSRRTGLARGYLCNLENGRTGNPTVDTLALIADAYEIRIGWLAEGALKEEA